MFERSGPRTVAGIPSDDPKRTRPRHPVGALPLAIAACSAVGCKDPCDTTAADVNRAVVEADLFPPKALACAGRPYIYPDASNAAWSYYAATPTRALEVYRAHATERGWVGEDCPSVVPYVFQFREPEEIAAMARCFSRPGEPGRNLVIRAEWIPRVEQSHVGVFLDFPPPSTDGPPAHVDVSTFVVADAPKDPVALAQVVQTGIGQMLDEATAAAESSLDPTVLEPALRQVHDRYVRFLIQIGLHRRTLDDHDKEAFDREIEPHLPGRRMTSVYLLRTDVADPACRELLRSIVAAEDHLHLRGVRTARSASRLGIELPVDTRGPPALVDAEVPPDTDLGMWAARVHAEFVGAVALAVERTHHPADQQHDLWRAHDRYIKVLLAVGLRRQGMTPSQRATFDADFTAQLAKNPDQRGALGNACMAMTAEDQDVCELASHPEKTIRLVGNATLRGAERLSVTLPEPEIDCAALYRLELARKVCGVAFDESQSEQDSGYGEDTCTGMYKVDGLRFLKFRHHMAATVEEARRDSDLVPSSDLRSMTAPLKGLGEEAYAGAIADGHFNLLAARRGRHVVKLNASSAACSPEALIRLARSILADAP